jgi:hypothetical protein
MVDIICLDAVVTDNHFVQLARENAYLHIEFENFRF